MAFADLLLAATIPVIKVLLVTGVGCFLALDRVNVLSNAARKHLNDVVFYVYSPAFLSANLSKTITLKNMVSLWFMPLNILLTFVIGAALGCIVTKTTRPPPHLRGLIIGCCSAGNLGSMLFIIVPAICKEKGSPFGAPDQCIPYGLAYVSLSMAIGAIFFWSIVYNIVRMSSNQDTVNLMHSKECNPGHTELAIEISASNSPTDVSVSDVQNSGHGESNVKKWKLPALEKYKQIVIKVSEKIHWKELITPSIIGVIIGFIVGVVSDIRKAFIGGNAPLHVIHDSVALLGDGAIPTMMLISGGNLVKGLKDSEIRRSFVIGIVFVRYVILPLVGLAVVSVAHRLGLVHSDPLYRFVLMIHFAVPPAFNLGTITQLLGAGESECSVILLWTYALAALSLTLWSALFLWLVSR